MKGIQAGSVGQQQRNEELLAGVRYLGPRITSRVLPLHVDIRQAESLKAEQEQARYALNKFKECVEQAGGTSE